jgi:hypothetical protein
VRQKSALNGSQRLCDAGVIDGKGIGGREVLGERISGVTMNGVSVASMLVQDARNINRRRFNILFIAAALFS